VLLKIRFFILLFLVIPSSTFSLQLRPQGCILKDASEQKLYDHALERIQHISFTSQNFPKRLKPLSVFDFKTNNPFPFVPNSQKVWYDTTEISNILVLLIEFEDPSHNQIPNPNDPGQMWVDDFSPDHYKNMLFDRRPEKYTMTNFYLENSSGRYTVDGNAHGWFKVPHPESFYGADAKDRHDLDGANGPVWRVIQDAAPLIAQDPAIDWASYDKIDRYDWDSDGDFSEPDGYIDHAMIVHAGVGQEEDGGAQGDDAIWSHRGRANYQPIQLGIQAVGPQKYVKRGGIQVDPAHDLWVLDYTMMPENGAPGVFSHEFGHDLGLPDLYDTEPQNNSDSSVAFWSIMSQGSWASLKDTPQGSVPTHFSAWEKMKLGWLDYDEVTLGNEDIHKFALLDNVEFHGRKAQALKINLPKAKRTTKIAEPIEGKFFWYSARGDDLVNSLTTEIDLTGVLKATLTFKAFYDIEPDFDYAYVEIEDQEGKLVSISGNITVDTNPNGNNLGHGITGSSGQWVDATFDLTPYVGMKKKLRFRYITDPGENRPGFAVDEVKILETGFQENFEEEKPEWVSKGFLRLEAGNFHQTYEHAYFAEWRKDVGFDQALSSVSYHIKEDKELRYYAYSPGLLLWYFNGFFTEGDNQVGKHPGEGSLLVVDARPEPQKNGEGKPVRNTFQLHDATFGFMTSPKFDIAGKFMLGGTPAMPVFNDFYSYYRSEAPNNSVQIPSLGLTFSLLNTSPDESAVQIALHYSSPK